MELNFFYENRAYGISGHLRNSPARATAMVQG